MNYQNLVAVDRGALKMAINILCRNGADEAAKALENCCQEIWLSPHLSADRLAYEGAREDLLDWKRRALTAEAKLAEASEPVAIVQHGNRIEWLEDFPAHCAKPGTKLYAATPAPAVPDAEAMAQAASDFFADMTNDDNTLAFDHCSSYDIDMLVAAMLSAAPKPEAL